MMKKVLESLFVGMEKEIVPLKLETMAMMLTMMAVLVELSMMDMFALEVQLIPQTLEKSDQL